MRSTHGNIAVVPGNDLVKKYNNYNYTYSNYQCNNNSAAIPYHARENSLPFSYGQIGKTSTPLRKTSAPSQYISGSSSGNVIDFNGAETNGNSKSSMIKTQPRLTSPLLVRKTLSSSRQSSPPPRSSSTNTISNTYHYNYGGSSVSGTGSKLNSYSKTQPRFDFEELLRERRDKVYSEYGQRDPVPPEPPQRQYASHLLTRQHQLPNGSGTNSPTIASSPSKSKYNYDIEFNLNLDNLDLGLRSRTLDHRPYQTHDIDVPDTAAATSRHYHTINFGNNGYSKTAYIERPPLEVAQQSTYNEQTTSATYGSNSLLPCTSLYSKNNNNINDNNINDNHNTVSFGQTCNEYGYRGSAQTLLSPKLRTRDLSPIYATTSKQQQPQQRHQHSIQTSTNASTQTVKHNTYIAELGYPVPSPPSAAASMRPETPAFPVTPRTPYGTQNGYITPQIYTQSPTPPRNIEKQQQQQQEHYTSESTYQTTQRPRLNSSLSYASSSNNIELQEVAAHLVKFARNSAKYWYKPNLSREDAINFLISAPPGTFLVRDSTTYKNAYGLVLRVAQPPPGTQTNQPQELVRHFLIEPTQRGVRLKGCANEPIFTSLSALVYEHSINQLALPCLLRIPDADIVQPVVEQTAAQKQLLTHGAATNVLWLFSCGTESLTGVEAIRKAIRQLYAKQPLPTPTEVHFKVTQQGITLTDNTRTKFFRKHYAADVISYCALDPDNHLWSMQPESEQQVSELKKTIFAFVARRSPSSTDNQCHIFCDLNINQPASAIVSFANRMLPTEKQRNYVL